MCSRLAPFPGFLDVNFFRSEAEVVQRYADHASEHGKIADPFNRLLPQPHDPRNARIFGQPAVSLGIGDVMEHIDNACATDALGIVNTGIGMSKLFAKLFGTRFRLGFQVVFQTELQTSRRTGFDARRLKPFGNAVRAQCALEYLLV